MTLLQVGVLAISLDNIDVLSKWRVESEMPIMEEAPAWLEEEPEQQQDLEEQQGEGRREGGGGGVA
jgi:hypothetical protein